MTRLRPPVLALALFALAGCQSVQMVSVVGPTRAVWVTRYEYRTADDIAKVLDFARGAGFNTVLFQVRGNGTAFYDSDFEPWADELGGRDPGFDPLEVACRLAHDKGLALHAWVNVMPSWRGDAPPADPDQLYNERPEWHWYAKDGARQPLNSGFYVSLNPCLPEVRDYLTDLIEQIAVDYPVDGIHLDYIRFVDDEARAVDYPRDARTLELYRAERGLAPDDDAAAWKTWKAENVTLLVRKIRAAVKRARPLAVVSAAVGARPEGPTDPHQRDSGRWAKQSIVDAVFPMNYTKDPVAFAANARAWRDLKPKAKVVMGVQIGDDRADSAVRQQLEAAIDTVEHVSVFSLSALFGPGSSAARRSVVTKALARRGAIGVATPRGS